MEKCGQSDYVSCLLGVKSGFDFDSEDAYRDVALLGTTDDSCKKLAELLGWEVKKTEPIYST
jgi:NAD-dependent deacetylase sirtuin 2